MADYYPLIARAIEGLSESSASSRTSVYDRARTALLEQLRQLDPPLSEAEIETERLSLDAAIAKVEGEQRSSDEAEPKGEAGSFDFVTVADSETQEEAFEPEGANAEGLLGTARPRVDSMAPTMRTAGRGRGVLLGATLGIVIAAIAIAAWFLRDTPETVGEETPVAQAPQATPADGAKFNERVGGGPPTPPVSGRSDAPTAQRAVLFEEDAANPRAPRSSVGRATWRLDAINAGQGQPLETVVRANVDIPEAGLAMTLLIRKNQDNTLPASHTVEVAFTTRPGETGRAIRDIGLLQFKEDFNTRGSPVAGQRVTLGENLFVIGLLTSDVVRNGELMRRGWVDVPILMASGQRAVLTFEKGASGEQAMNEAWARWQQ